MRRFAPPLFQGTWVPPDPWDDQRAALLESITRELNTGILPMGARFEIVCCVLRTFAARTSLGWMGEPFTRFAGQPEEPPERRPGLRGGLLSLTIADVLSRREAALPGGS